MGAWVWRDEDNHLRCRRSPGGTEWYVRLQRGGVFELWDRPPVQPAAAAGEPDASSQPGRMEVGRIDPETAEQIVKFLLREKRQRQRQDGEDEG